MALHKVKMNIQRLDGLVIGAGSMVRIGWNAERSMVYIEDSNKDRIHIRAATLHEKVTGIRKPPSEKTLRKWVLDGTAKSLGGNSIEPDGIDFDGYPSWLLALRLI